MTSLKIALYTNLVESVELFYEKKKFSENLKAS